MVLKEHRRTDLGAGSEDPSENLADQGNTPQTPGGQGNGPQTPGDQGNTPQTPGDQGDLSSTSIRPKIETEQSGAYTFYKGLDGFEGQGNLPCYQTLNTNPQAVMDWCNRTRQNVTDIIHILRMGMVVKQIQSQSLL